MDQQEYEALLVAIERTIESSVRGYRRGVHFEILAGLEETAQEQDRLHNGSDGDSGGQCLESNAREYRAGRRGTKVEGTP